MLCWFWLAVGFVLASVFCLLDLRVLVIVIVCRVCCCLSLYCGGCFFSVSFVIICWCGAGRAAVSFVLVLISYAVLVLLHMS